MPVSFPLVRSLRRGGRLACRAPGAHPFAVRGGVLLAGNGVVGVGTTAPSFEAPSTASGCRARNSR